MRTRMEALLGMDLLTHVSHLKMVQAYGDALQYTLLDQGEDWGLSLWYPAAWSAYDRAAYPEAEQIVYLAASRPSLLDVAINVLPRIGSVIFKLTGPDQAACAAKRYALTRKRAYWTYTCAEGAVLSPEPQVLRISQPDAGVQALWALNGYDVPEIKAQLQAG